MSTRTMKDGSEVNEMDTPIILTIKTKCPAKWLLIDRETGESYVPYDTSGTMQWKKIYNVEWNIDA